MRIETSIAKTPKEVFEEDNWKQVNQLHGSISLSEYFVSTCVHTNERRAYALQSCA